MLSSTCGCAICASSRKCRSRRKTGSCVPSASRSRSSSALKRNSGKRSPKKSIDFFGDLFPLFLFRADELLERLALGTQLPVFRLDLDFLELAQIAQPHVEDGVGLHVRELEGL